MIQAYPLRQFESFVNSDRYKALSYGISIINEFESFVNSDRYKASNLSDENQVLFESFVLVF